MAIVRVQLCYMWMCPCGHKNYAEGLEQEMTPDQLADSIEAAGIEVPDDTVALALPEFVVCRRCFEKHETAGPLSDPIDFPDK